jgi:agmatine deiminase
MKITTPKELGYYFPAEFAIHEATWLSWPHKEASWPGKIHTIYPSYVEFIKELTAGEKVCINVKDDAMKTFAEGHLKKANIDLNKVTFFFHPRSWPRIFNQPPCGKKESNCRLELQCLGQ